MSERAKTIWIVRRILDREVERMAAGLKGAVLDIGAGPQPYRDLLYRSGVKRYVALDWVKSLHGMGMDVAADVAGLPFVGESFDGVLCTQVLEHCPDPARALAEVARVLRPGGRLLISVPFLFQVHELPWDYYRYTHEGIRHLLAGAALSLVEMRRQGGAVVVIAILASRTAGIVFEWVGDTVSGILGRVFGREAGISWPSAAARCMAWLVAFCLQLPVYCGHLLAGKVVARCGERRWFRPLRALADKLGGEMTAGYVILAEKRKARANDA